MKKQGCLGGKRDKPARPDFFDPFAATWLKSTPFL
jgi:hypothetical protein